MQGFNFLLLALLLFVEAFAYKLQNTELFEFYGLEHYFLVMSYYHSKGMSEV